MLLAIITIIITAILAIMGFFLKRVIDDVEHSINLGNDNKNEIQLVKQENELKHDFASKEYSELKTAMKDLTKELKELNNKLTNR